MQHNSFPSLARTQRGVTIILALVVLSAVLLASVAFVRAIDGTGLLARNFAFRKQTVALQQGAVFECVRRFNQALNVNAAMTKRNLAYGGFGFTGYRPFIALTGIWNQPFAAPLPPALTPTGIPLELVNKVNVTTFSWNGSEVSCLIERACPEPGPANIACHGIRTYSGNSAPLDGRSPYSANQETFYRMHARIDNPRGSPLYIRFDLTENDGLPVFN
ncbi:hypothetical protein [Parvibium lacunae]|uniref:Type 4 fimbrial biogenesis protein PilX N-terminal domain-containing protein n=1 Tax=Parvibium lacunae TaxID=1888893 RepID=A0A368L1M5_9BURK|nr:hypothetical protein [Parvibium lacunae]RCS57383.1 hypothetical protein DU000_07920 [Parvibium lacunae]